MSNVDHSVTERLAQHLLRPIPASVRTSARLHLLDWIGCVAGAGKSEPALLLRADKALPLAVRAAWLGNVLEMDDIHRTAILHPGPAIWPAVLGAGDDVLDGAIDAAVAGYDAMIGVGSMLDARHYSYWHNTATAGVFGATAAAAIRIGCDHAQLVSALGLAGSVTGGLWQMRHEPVMAKQWHLAHVVSTGHAAAHAARRGITGPRFILEGPQGLFAASCAQPKPLILPDEWRIGEVSFKPWGACRHAHPAIDAALELRALGQLHGPVTVSTYRDALTFCDRPDPQTVFEAKFSLQHAVAIVMMRGVPQLADFEPAAVEALTDARKLVSVEENSILTKAYPAHFGARISSASGDILMADARGDPERPLSRNDVIAKARALMVWGGINPEQAKGAIDTVLKTDRTSDILALLEAWL